MPASHCANPPEKVSIVIVVHNGLDELTRPCLDSVFSSSDGCDVEVVVVDNGSSDGTAGYLEELSAAEPRLKCVFNRQNRGYAGGNNDGIRAASGDYLVLLNNDTLVTPGWIPGLLAPLVLDRTVGLSGPVTNACGNEQAIYVSGSTPQDILAEGLDWAEKSRGDRFDTERIGFFCVAMRRELLAKVGLLDESFGRGFYEDDDYCLRVRGAGYRFVCVEDVFVFHRGSASFNRMPKESRELMRRNLRLLEEKHGGAYRPAHPRDRQLDLVGAYLASSRGPGDLDRMLFKMRNRLKWAESRGPRGLLKKLAFKARLAGLKKEIGEFHGR